MAEYYDMQETMDKLRKSEQEVQEMIKQGQIRQYMDAGKAVFKVEDIDALAEEIVGLDVSSIGLAPDGSDMDIQLEETSEIQLEPDEGEPEKTKGPGPDDLELDIEPDVPGAKESEGGFGLSQMGDLTMADTNVGTVGINILSGTGDAYKLTEDSKAETSAADVDDLDTLDEDVNLESFGSGSGLLDLSLQADDTSLGAVLDDILPAGAEGGAAEGGGDFPVEEVGLAEEPEDLLAETEPLASELEGEDVTAPMGPAQTAPVMPGAQMVAVSPVDPKTSVFGILMFLPMLALILAAVVLAAAIQGVVPALLKTLAEAEVAGFSMTWAVVGGMLVLSLLILAFSAVSGGGGTKTKRAPKAKKEKKPKAKKEKKPKAKKEKKPKKEKAPKKKRK
jgi:hypothetical protein